MPKNSTICTSNVYYYARKEASSCNERLNSREGAAEETGIDRTRIANIEIGNVIPYPEEVLMFAETYNAPDLENKHCSQVCPIGKRRVPCLEISSADKAVLNFMAAYIDLKRSDNEIEDLVIKAAEDGTVTDKTMSLLLRIMEKATTLNTRTQELILWTEKNIKRSEVP